jgi:hypothetical protein
VTATVRDSWAYQKRQRLTYDDYRIGIEEEIKTDPRIFFWQVDLKKKRVGYPSVMNFEGQSGSGSQKICDLFAGLIEWTYMDKPWMPSHPGPDDVSDEPPFGSLQFTVLEVLNGILDLDTNKGPGRDGVPVFALELW